MGLLTSEYNESSLWKGRHFKGHSMTVSDYIDDIYYLNYDINYNVKEWEPPCFKEDGKYLHQQDLFDEFQNFYMKNIKINISKQYDHSIFVILNRYNMTNYYKSLNNKITYLEKNNIKKLTLDGHNINIYADLISCNKFKNYENGVKNINLFCKEMQVTPIDFNLYKNCNIKTDRFILDKHPGYLLLDNIIKNKNTIETDALIFDKYKHKKYKDIKTIIEYFKENISKLEQIFNFKYIFLIFENYTQGILITKDKETALMDMMFNQPNYSYIYKTFPGTDMSKLLGIYYQQKVFWNSKDLNYILKDKINDWEIYNVTIKSNRNR